MLAKVTGYKVLEKNGKLLCIVSYVRPARLESGEVGNIAETQFLPPYCFDDVGSYVGKLCNISFSKYHDKYTVRSVEVCDTSSLSDI